jgi:hypothetical protein
MHLYRVMKHVLLIEDSGDDLRVMKKACQRTCIPHSIHVVVNDDEAVRYLEGSGPYAYKLGVTSYLQKAACPAEFGQAVRVILKYWLELNIAPDAHLSQFQTAG